LHFNNYALRDGGKTAWSNNLKTDEECLVGASVSLPKAEKVSVGEKEGGEKSECWRKKKGWEREQI